MKSHFFFGLRNLGSLGCGVLSSLIVDPAAMYFSTVHEFFDPEFAVPGLDDYLFS